MCADHRAAEAEALAVELVRHGAGNWTRFERVIEVREESGEPFVRVKVAATLETERLK